MTADTIVQLADDVESVAFADVLADQLSLRRIPFGATETAGAALAVAPAAGRHLREVALPTVTFTRSATARRLEGRTVICGARDEGDAPALAIADAIAHVLELPLLVVHVLPAISAPAFPSWGVPPPHGPTRQDRLQAVAMLDRLADAAGVDVPCDGGSRVLCGAAAAELAALARSEDAALVVVGGTNRSRLRRALLPSAANLLARRCDRPVAVCPRDPVAAMRVREALGWRACRRPT
jgi:nucleotide-binding universal stress UspA family protein